MQRHARSATTREEEGSARAQSPQTPPCAPLDDFDTGQWRERVSVDGPRGRLSQTGVGAGASRGVCA
jgi:hypothetical protein